jgi:pimeloyl-ACP methyl ester carboxylesterase
MVAASIGGVGQVSGAVALPDGRRLAYCQYGPPDGVPVVFIAGAACGRLMAFGQDLLHSRGIRLISVDRPGLGRSSADPAKTFDSIGADIAVLIEAVAGRPAVVVANSQGAPFGLAVATTGWARGLVLASPVDDVGHPGTTALLPAEYRGLVEEVTSDPDTALRTLSGFDADAMFDMLLGDHPAADAPVYGDPGFRSLLRTALRDGFSSGAAGYARDTVLAMSAWPTALFDPGVPVRILFGAQDRVHSPDLGSTLTRRIRGAQRTVIRAAGGALLWSHADLVLDEAAALGR